MTSIRIQNISDARIKRTKAIARVKFGLKVRDYVKLLLDQQESQYDAAEMQRIMSLYETIKDED
jgi:hypothetical protein